MAATFPTTSDGTSTTRGPLGQVLVPGVDARRLTDSHGREIHDLRVSITDRCNYKCIYCRTGEYGAQYPELAIDEYLRLIRLFVSLGIEKVRLTGGEPLLRNGLIELIEELAKLRTVSGELLDGRAV